LQCKEATEGCSHLHGCGNHTMEMTYASHVHPVGLAHNDVAELKTDSSFASCA